jgi:oligosaccharide reducing-end xylanase
VLVVTLAAGVTAAGAGAGCHSTVDSLGYNDASGIVLHKMTGPSSYQNAFLDLLGKSHDEIAAKIASSFDRMFHSEDAIYMTVPGQTNQAFIQDTLHGDIRTEGPGLGMLIAVELDKRDEFDHLWAYAKAVQQASAGAEKGYFMSSCAPAPAASTCFDPYGMQHMLMALLLANDLWANAAGGPDYGADAKDLLTVMRHKEDENGGVSNGVTDVFDDSTALVFDLPTAKLTGQTRPSIELPAFYERWAEATGDPFWTRAAASARVFWRAAANPKTGLVPLRARLDGTPLPGSDTFSPETYRTQINLALDGIWSPGHAWDGEEADRLLRFFIGEGITAYGREFTLEGATVDSMRDASLVVTNGVTGVIATIDQRKAFIDAVWNLVPPPGQARYFIGILHMMSLLILSGQCRVL